GYAGLPKWRERLEEGERIISAAGGSPVGVYFTLGRYAGVEFFGAPDDDVAIEILMKLNRYGAEHTETLRAFTREEAEEIVRKLWPAMRSAQSRSSETATAFARCVAHSA